MKNLTINELKIIDGGNFRSSNYIGGLSPAIPQSGGDAAVGFIVGFFKGLFDELF
jgi:hypothetical protein